MGGGGVQFSYAEIPQIASLSEPLKTQVRNAFADSLDVLWQVVVGIAAVGLVSSLVMKEVVMQSVTDERWGLERKGKGNGNGSEEGVVEGGEGGSGSPAMTAEKPS
jgi:hypothetical protein